MKLEEFNPVSLVGCDGVCVCGGDAEGRSMSRGWVTVDPAPLSFSL